MSIFKAIDSLTARILDRLGDWNPQLLRELKGRLQKVSVLTALGLSLLVQLVLLLGYISVLPGAVDAANLTLTTYPQLDWSYASDLPPAVQTQVLPTGPTEPIVRAKGLFITDLGDKEPVWGKSSLGATAQQQLQVGDRLVALEGVPIAQLEQEIKTEISGDPNALWTEDHIWAHQNHVSALIRGAEGLQLTPDRQYLIDSMVELTLERPGQAPFTVAIPRVALLNRSPSYCLGIAGRRQCQLSADKRFYQIDWSQWYQEIFVTLSGLMTLSLMGLGTFLLTHNVVDEKRQGTLNFLRMSPRSALTILGGKLMGVPICLYLAIAAMVPFQIYTALAAGMQGAHLLGFDIAVLSQTVVLYGIALLLGLATQAPLLLSLIPWLAAGGGLAFQWLVGAMSLMIWDSDLPVTVLTWATLFSPLGSAGYFINFDHLAYAPDELNLAFGIFRINFAEYTVLTLLHACGWGVVLGHALQRRFENASQSLLARRYSYLLTGVVMAVVLGGSETVVKRHDLFPLLATIALFSGLYSLVLVLSLIGDRQTLQDWARFRTARLPHEGRLPLGKDLLIGDTSSPILAIGLNLVLMAALFTVWAMLYHWSAISAKLNWVSLVGSLLIFIGSVFFAALASQVLLLAKRQKSWIWFSAIGSISCLFFPALTLMIGIGLMPTSLDSRPLWGLPAEIAMFAVPLGLMGSLTIVLAALHWRQLVLVGRSEYQQLLAAEPTS